MRADGTRPAKTHADNYRSPAHNESMKNGIPPRPVQFVRHVPGLFCQLSSRFIPSRTYSKTKRSLSSITLLVFQAMMTFYRHPASSQCRRCARSVLSTILPVYPIALLLKDKAQPLFHHTARFPGHNDVLSPSRLVAVSEMPPVQYVEHLTGPYPVFTPHPPSSKECKFPSKPCRLFVTRLESMAVENFSPPNPPIS